MTLWNKKEHFDKQEKQVQLYLQFIQINIIFSLDIEVSKYCYISRRISLPGGSDGQNHDGKRKKKKKEN